MEFNNRFLEFLTHRIGPGGFTPFSTVSLPRAGELLISTRVRQKMSTTYMPSVIYRHDGPIWKMEAGAAHSHASNRYADTTKGYFNEVIARRQNLTIAFSNIFYLRPRVITIVDNATGRPLDPNDITNYVLTSAVSDSAEQRRFETQRLRECATQFFHAQSLSGSRRASMCDSRCAIFAATLPR